MPRQNRVQPDGQILAHPARGAFMGNRGILHDDTAHMHGTLTRRRWRHKAFLAAAEHSGSAPDFDALLHAARAVPRVYGQNRPLADASTLPDATFILTDTGPALLLADMALPFSPEGYAAPIKRPQGTLPVLTPAPTRIALRNGFRPTLRLPAPLA